MASVMATEAKVFTDEIEEIKVESSKSLELKMLKIILACLAIVDGWIDGLHKKASTEVEAVVPGIKNGSADQIALI